MSSPVSVMTDGETVDRPHPRTPRHRVRHAAITGGEIALQHFVGRRLLLVFMQPGCGPCHQITPDLNGLHDAGEVQVLVIQNADSE